MSGLWLYALGCVLGGVLALAIMAIAYYIGVLLTGEDPGDPWEL